MAKGFSSAFYYSIKGGLCRNLERTKEEIINILLETKLAENPEEAENVFDFMNERSITYKLVPDAAFFDRLYPRGFRLSKRVRKDGTPLYKIEETYSRLG